MENITKIFKARIPKIAFVMVIFILLLQSSSTFIQADIINDTNNNEFLSNYVQTQYDAESAIPVGQVKFSLQSSDGYMWFAGYQGLMRYDGINTKVFSYEDGFPSHSVNLLYEDNDKNIWVATNDSGVVLIQKTKIYTFGLEFGIPSLSIRDITGDEHGNIYVATTAGISMRTSEGEWHTLLTNEYVKKIVYIGGDTLLCLSNDGEIFKQKGEEKIPLLYKFVRTNDVANSLFISENGNVYIGTMDGRIYITDINLVYSRSLISINFDVITSFYQDSEERIWVCASSGIGYINADKIIYLNGLKIDNSLEHIFEDHEGNYWISSSRQGLLQLIPSKFTNISFVAKLPEQTVNSTAIFNGDLYIGSDNGLAILKNNKVIVNELTQKLEGVRIRSLFVDSKNQLWICTFEKFGLIVIKPDERTLSIDTSLGLTSNQVRCVIETVNGDIVVGTSNGLNIIKDYRVVRKYTEKDGLLNAMVLNLSTDRAGNIYIGSDGGGLYVLNKKGITNYTEKDGLGSGIVLRTVVGNGGIWISTGNAVCFMDNSGSIRKIDKLGSYANSVLDIKLFDDKIWFLLNNAINICNVQNLLSDEELKIEKLRKKDGLSDGVTANAWNYLANDEILYISTVKGVLSINTKLIRKNENMPKVAVTSILVDNVPINISSPIIISRSASRVDFHISLLSYNSKEGTISYKLDGFDKDYNTVQRNVVYWVSYTNLSGGEYTFRLYGTDSLGIKSLQKDYLIKKEYSFTETPFFKQLAIVFIIGLIYSVCLLLIKYKRKMVDKQQKLQKAIIMNSSLLIASITELKNEYIKGHSFRVARYCEMIGERLFMSDIDLFALNCAALVHDIGLAKIPESIMNKKDKLTKEEYDIIKSHTIVASEVLSTVPNVELVISAVKYHHERIDGNGYNEGLERDEIPLFARIISVCDAFDAMSVERPYRKALDIKVIKSELINNAGSQFDETIVAIMIELIEEKVVPIIEYKDSV